MHRTDVRGRLGRLLPNARRDRRACA